MSRNIKDLKPNLNSRFKQGYINPESCKKLFPQLKFDKIIYRSSYEKKFIYWMENNPSVKYWGSECVKIPYLYVKDNKMHSYYPDYFIEMHDGTYMIIEIKPLAQTQKPLNENSWAGDAYIKNICKWKATMKFCKSKEYLLKILTEKTIANI